MSNQVRPKRHGSAAVELAVCLPFLLIIVFGVWEVGRMVQAQELVANAAREGGRQASTGQSDATTVRQSVVNYLNMNGLTGVTLNDVTLTNLTDASRSDPTKGEQFDQYRVTVTVPYSSIRWSTAAQITSTKTLIASADWFCMRDVPINVDLTIPTN
jgi:Flp pilus assembly protein TadG